MLTVEQAARELGVTISRVHARIKAESLRAKRVGPIWLVYRDHLFYSKRKPGRPRKVGA